MPLPDGSTAVVIATPFGGDLTPVVPAIYRNRTLLRNLSPEVKDPRNGKRIYVHPDPVSVIGDEYSRGRNEIVNLIFQMETDMTAANHEAESQQARAQGRVPRIVPPVRFDFVLWLDDDVQPPEDIITRLMAHDLPIVSALYYMRKDPHLPVAYLPTNDPNIPDRFWHLLDVDAAPLREVAAVGFGAVLIKLEVFRDIPQPWFAWRPASEVYMVDDQTISETRAKREELDHRTVGEDLYFCIKAGRSGYKVHLDTTIVCTHWGFTGIDDKPFREKAHNALRYALPGRKSVCFITAVSPKPWDGRSIYTESLGGAETCVAYVARELARRHYTVFVAANTPGNLEIDVDGVCYRPYSFAPGLCQHPWDALVIVRDRTVYQMPTHKDVKTCIFWSHDLIAPDQIPYAYGIDRVNVGEWGADAFVALTPFHAAMSRVLQWPIGPSIIHNGIDPELFKGEEERDHNRLIWTSNPNRGLMNGIRLFRTLRKDLPELELHVYGRSSVYGWTSGTDPMHEHYYLPYRDEPGVFLHDPLPKHLLARELMKSHALFYPTSWPETFSLAVLEAQAAGTPVITPPYAALPYTVQSNPLDWDTTKLFYYLQDPQNWELSSLRGKEFAAKLTWATAADAWEELITTSPGRARDAYIRYTNGLPLEPAAPQTA